MPSCILFSLSGSPKVVTISTKVMTLCKAKPNLLVRNTFIINVKPILYSINGLKSNLHLYNMHLDFKLFINKSDYPHMPTVCRHTDKHLRLVMTSLFYAALTFDLDL